MCVCVRERERERKRENKRSRQTRKLTHREESIYDFYLRKKKRMNEYSKRQITIDLHL